MLKRDGLGLDSSPDPRHSQLMERNEHGYRWFEHDQKKSACMRAGSICFQKLRLALLKI
jgi:hypothetical protein